MFGPSVRSATLHFLPLIDAPMLSPALPITTTLLKKILFHNPALPVPIFHAAIIEKATQIPMRFFLEASCLRALSTVHYL